MPWWSLIETHIAGIDGKCRRNFRLNPSQFTVFCNVIALLAGSDIRTATAVSNLSVFPDHNCNSSEQPLDIFRFSKLFEFLTSVRLFVISNTRCLPYYTFGASVRCSVCSVLFIGNRNSSVTVVTRLWAGRSRKLSSVTGRGNIFLFCKESRPAVGSTQLPIKSVLGALPEVKSPDR